MPHKELSKQSIIYSGPLIWNNVPENLRQEDTIDSFHKLLTNIKMIHMMNSVCVCVWGVMLTLCLLGNFKHFLSSGVFINQTFCDYLQCVKQLSFRSCHRGGGGGGGGGGLNAFY